MTVLYDTIGIDYANLRRADHRIAEQIDAALGDARSVLNIGAGAGSYEPTGRKVTAVEHSIEMIHQRPESSVRVTQAVAEDLPFRDDTFDAAMAFLTIHHWSDKVAGVREMRRVTRGRLVFLTYDPGFQGFWLADYFPALVTLDRVQMPRLADLEAWLGPIRVTPVPIPHDCSDGFLAAYWRRPTAYLDNRLRAAMSPLRMLGDVSEGLTKLNDDLRSGDWTRQYGHLADLAELDCGYRLVTAGRC